MQRIALLGAAAAGLMFAVPANAQHSRGHSYSHGHDSHDYGHHDYGHHDYHGYNGYGHGSYHGYGGYGYSGYGYGGYYSRPRVECRIERGYYGPVRRCFSTWR